jgi:hypothetical protein
MDQVEPSGRDPVRLTACRSCGSAALVDVLDMGAIADSSAGKNCPRMPGTGIRFISASDWIHTRADSVIILTRDFADEVPTQLSHLMDPGARFHILLTEGASVI